MFYMYSDIFDINYLVFLMKNILRYRYNCYLSNIVLVNFENHKNNKGHLGKTNIYIHYFHSKLSKMYDMTDMFSLKLLNKIRNHSNLSKRIHHQLLKSTNLSGMKSDRFNFDVNIYLMKMCHTMYIYLTKFHIICNFMSIFSIFSSIYLNNILQDINLDNNKSLKFLLLSNLPKV